MQMLSPTLQEFSISSRTKYRDTQVCTGFGSAENVNGENSRGKQKPLHNSYGLIPAFSKPLCNLLCPVMGTEPKLEVRIK